MGKTPNKNEPPFRPNPNRRHPPVDKSVRLPHQVLRAVARTEDLQAGRQPRPAEVTAAPAKTRAEAKIPYSDVEIDAVLDRWDQGKLVVTDPAFGIVIELARHGARMIKANRQGARKDRKTSTEVTKRLQFLIQSYSELSPKLRAHPTGQPTVERLRKSVIQKLGLAESDKAIPEDTIRKDIHMVRPILRLIQQGIIPLPGKREGEQGRSEKTRLEMEAGRAALRRAAALTAPHAPRKRSKRLPNDS
jgi:hypothetical protein